MHLLNITSLQNHTNGSILIQPNTYPYNLLGSSFGSKHAEDACPAAHVQHYFVLKQMLVVEHGIAVGQSANLIFQHFLQWY